MIVKSNPQYRKNFRSANSSRVPIAAAHVAQAELYLRQQAGDEVAGGIASRLLQFADAIHELIPPIEKLEQVLHLEQVAGGRP